MGVERSHVIEICQQYKIKDWKTEFQTELRNCFLLAIGNFLLDLNIDESEVSQLNRLVELCCITNEEKMAIYQKAGASAYDELFVSFVNDEILTDSEKEILLKLKTTLSLSEESIQKLINARVHEIAERSMNEILVDKQIGPGELEAFIAKCSNLGVNYTFNEESQKVLDDYKDNWRLENEPLKEIEVSINLQKGEVCYYITNVTWHEIRTITQAYSYGGPAIRFKIVKGIYFRGGRTAVRRITSDQLTELDAGKLYVTNKRLIFDGLVRNTTIPYKSVLAIEPFEDGIRVEKEKGKSPVFQTLSTDHKLSIVLGRIFSELKD
ncbi:MAG: hypothetical protein RJA38_532 [Bacteroidota bacterium]